MIAIDTNILVYAHRPEPVHHRAAAEAVRSLCESGAAWAIPWPCVHEFLGNVTHPRIYRQPSSVAVGMKQLDAWYASGTLRWIGEMPSHLAVLNDLMVAGKVWGGAVHDARIAAICMTHRISELWSADRDFSRHASLNVVNPLVR